MPVGTRGAVKYLSAADYERARRRDRARQHVPPDAAARAPTSSPRFGGLGRFAGWDGLRSPTPAASRCSRSTRRSTTTASRSARTYDGSTPPPHAGVGGRRAGAARRRHPDGARRLPAAAGAARRGPRWRSSAPPRGPSGPAPAHRRDRPGAVRHRAGRHRRGAARGERRAAPSSSTSTATASAGCRSARPRDEMLPALAAALGELPGRPAPLPDGRRRPGVARRGGRPRRRPVRLRAADPPRPPRHGAHRDGHGST